MLNANAIFKDYMGKLRISDIRSASEEIVNYVIRHHLMICDQGQVYVNYGTHFSLCKPDAVGDYLYSLLPPDQASQIPTRVVDEAKKRLLRHPLLRVDMEVERENTSNFVNVRNGVYDISTGHFTENRENLIFDYILDFDFDPNPQIALARSFLAFVESSLGQVYLPCLLRILGYCISSLVKARLAFLFLGKGGTGKSTIFELIEAVVGVEQCAHVPFHSIGDLHSRAEFLAKRLNVSRDTSNLPLRCEDAFKLLTSGEMITGRKLYENLVDFVPRAKLLFASNVDLNFSHPDDAIYDRLLVIPFEKGIAPDKRDLGLLQKLLEERDIIFSAALCTLPELVKSGYQFGEPEPSKRIIARYRAALHTAESFLQECCTTDENGSVSSVLLYNRYCNWCSDNGLDADGQRTFYSHVRSFDPSICDGKVNSGGSRVNGFRGIALKDIDDTKSDGKQTE